MTDAVPPSSPATANGGGSEASEEILETVHMLRKLFRAHQSRLFAQDVQHRLSHTEGRVILFLSRNPGATHGDYVLHSGRDKGQIARVISSLRDQALVEAQVDPRDRRIQRLYLTQAGAALRDLLQRERRRVADIAVSGMNATERRTLTTLLRRVRANLETAG